MSLEVEICTIERDGMSSRCLVVTESFHFKRADDSDVLQSRSRQGM